MSLAMSRKDKRNPQNPWPKSWKFPKHYFQPINHIFHNKTLKIKIIDVYIQNRDRSLSIARKMAPKFVRNLSISDTNLPIIIQQRLKTTKIISIKGKSKILLPFRYHQIVNLREFYDLPYSRHLSRDFLFQSKQLKQLNFGKLQNEYMVSVLKACRHRNLDILHLSSQNNNIDSRWLNQLAVFRQIRELRIEIKRSNAENTKVSKFFEILKIVSPKVLKLDFYNLESFHDVVWDFDSCMNTLIENGVEVDFRTAHGFPKSFDTSKFLRGLDYYSLNSKASVQHDDPYLKEIQLYHQKNSKNKFLVTHAFSPSKLKLNNALPSLINITTFELIIANKMTAVFDDFWTGFSNLTQLKNFILSYDMFQHKQIIQQIGQSLSNIKTLKHVQLQLNGRFQYEHKNPINKFMKGISKIESLFLILRFCDMTSMNVIDTIYDNINSMSNLTGFKIMADENVQEHFMSLTDLFEENNNIQEIFVQVNDFAPVDNSWNLYFKPLSLSLQHLDLRIDVELDELFITNMCKELELLQILETIKIRSKNKVKEADFDALMRIFERFVELQEISLEFDVVLKLVVDFGWSLSKELNKLSKKQKSNDQSKGGGLIKNLKVIEAQEKTSKAIDEYLCRTFLNNQLLKKIEYKHDSQNIQLSHKRE